MAGNIIPAVVTSTAVVAGLATLELIKIAADLAAIAARAASIGRFRNHYIDLGKHSMAHTEPFPAETFVVTIRRGRTGTGTVGQLGRLPETFTLWDVVPVRYIACIIGALLRMDGRSHCIYMPICHRLRGTAEN